MSSPSIVVLAGPNGSGKTTAAPLLLRDALSVREYVNADPIAQGLSAFNADSVALSAGRLMLAPITRALAAAAHRGWLFRAPGVSLATQC